MLIYKDGPEEIVFPQGINTVHKNLLMKYWQLYF